MIETPRRASLAAAAVAALMFSCLPALSAGSGGSDSATNTSRPNYAEAQAAVDSGSYVQALRILAGVVKAEPRNADAWNLMGYASRKMNRLDEADRYYATALRIDPRHMGALEYQGELFLERGDVDRARQNLSMLRGLCRTCDEYKDLIAAFDAAGQS
ncbi:hypothetical protein DEA8626_03523 [Defluviimonas aquaemixtae]|uniref:Uncharacterized protein n=1 Tax=Albidovulum aquaemixtae TaxID=1542388 RepID=A0A2R8BMA1_9RHOB|nr:tetratricopeptide repeat protein [Defluviimonas aquaemixtae]SPH24471.1 hypothetical protein DEA8626_03523 [Defluviimonas aquaemixtae]